MGKRILLVEDDADIREVLNGILTVEGFSPTCARNAIDALERLRALPDEELPSLIILDVMMPGMDGCTFAKLLRAEPRWAATPIMIISADSDISEIAQSIGAIASLRKPFELEAFVSVVQRAA